MAKAISQYFKRIFDDYQVLVMVNPTDYSGIELIVHPDGKIEKKRKWSLTKKFLMTWKQMNSNLVERWNFN